MDIRTFKKQMHREIQALAEKNPYVTDVERFSQTDIWYLMLVTDRGRRRLIPSGDVGRDFFYADPVRDSPWAKRLAPLKPDTESPRVLFAGTSYEGRTIMARPPLEHEEIREICKRYNIQNARFDATAKIIYFWDRFFGTGKFLGGKAKDIPALIISTGFMRNYSDAGGETLEVWDRLIEIGESYKIPVEFIKPFWS